MNARTEETWWVLLAQSGDREALDALLQSVQEPLHRYLASIVGGSTAADDVLQESFLRIYRKLSWLREPELFRTWAYRIASNEAFRYLRRRQRPIETPEELPEIAVDAEPFVVTTSMETAMAGVSPASRAVIALHFFHEMPLKDIAAVLDIPLGTVKSRLAYGLSTLRKLLEVS